MSFTVTYRDLSNPYFFSAMQKLAQHGFEHHLTSYNVARIAKALDSELETYRELSRKVVDKFAEKDGKGLRIPAERREAYDAEMRDFGEVFFEVKRHRVKLDDLRGISLSPNELLALECLLETEDG